MGQPAARLATLLRTALRSPGPRMNVIIGGQPAWLGMSRRGGRGAVPKTLADGVKDVADKTAKAAAAASLGPVASAKAQKDLADAQAKALSDGANAMTGSGASTNICPMLTVLDPACDGRRHQAAARL